YSSWITFRYRKKTLQAPEKQYRASDATVDFGALFHTMAVRRKQTRIIIEFPDERAIRLPIRAVESQMLGHFIREMGIRFLHARDGRFEARIRFRLALLNFADRLDPIAHLFRRGAVHAAFQWRSQTFD